MTIRKGKTIIAGNSSNGLEIGDIGLSAIGIDESLNYRRYLNGQEILQAQFPEFTKKIKRRVKLYPSLACTNIEYETACTLSTHGQCGKFVIDNERGVIRLPKVVNVMGLSDMAEAGVTVDAGLPNIEGSTNTDSNTVMTGAFYGIQTSSGYTAGGSAGVYKTGFDASLSNPIYGNSETVQQEAIKYPYFIQVASSCETTINLTRDIELNNPFSLFEYKFSEYAIDNISWLESKGQWNSNKVYVSAYEELLAIYNGKIREGVSVKKTTETYTDYDFVIDEAGSTFRLPLKVLGAAGKAVVGNGMTLGLTDGTTNFGVSSREDYYGLQANTNDYGINIGQTATGTSNVDKTLGITTDPTKSGIETSTEGMKLYFYVGETVQDGNLINAGAVLEDVNTLKNTALTTNQITNCITEIPQRIKLELNDGTLTLKAGSEVVVPNGFEEDGVTPKFDYVTVENDITSNYGTGRTEMMVSIVNNAMEWSIIDQFLSGPTAPDTSVYPWYVWYDTTANKIKFYDTHSVPGTTRTFEGASFPICLISENEGSGYGYGVKSIDQVFNGIGYIGSTAWVDKGVKGLIPSGRNEDGSLKNIEFTTPQLVVRHWGYESTNQPLFIHKDAYGIPSSGVYYVSDTEPLTPDHNYVMWYNPVDNIMKYSSDNGKWTVHTDWLFTGIHTSSDAAANNYKLTKFTQPKQVFRAIDHSDKPEVSGWSMPSNKYIDLTLGASGATYTAPANGYFYACVNSGDTNFSYIWFASASSAITGEVGGVATGGGNRNALIPVRKGDVVFCGHSFRGNIIVFRFVYADGEV